MLSGAAAQGDDELQKEERNRTKNMVAWDNSVFICPAEERKKDVK